MKLAPQPHVQRRSASDEPASNDKAQAYPWNERCVDVPKAFNAVADKGLYRRYKARIDFFDGIWSHVQGMASYRSQYYIFTHSDYFGQHGRIIVVDRLKGEMVMMFSTTGAGLNHPGGCQVIGDFLAVALENQDGLGGVVHFYDLSMMNDQTRPLLLSKEVKRHAGAQVRQRLPILNGADNMCLLTDVNNSMFLLALSGNEVHGVGVVDWADLQFLSNTEFGLYCSARNFMEEYGFDEGVAINMFRPPG